MLGVGSNVGSRRKCASLLEPQHFADTKVLSHPQAKVEGSTLQAKVEGSTLQAKVEGATSSLDRSWRGVVVLVGGVGHWFSWSLMCTVSVAAC